MDEIEAQKRANYFDLGRDEFMALEEYLLSGLSDKDLGKAGGGMMGINDMTKPVGYEDGGITRRLASARAEKPFEDFLKDAGFTKKDEVTGKLRGAKGNWAKYLNSKNIKVGTVEATDELNRMLKAAGKPKYVDVKMAGKGTIEDLISEVTDTEPGKTKKGVNVADERNNASKKIKDLKTQGNKMHGANPSKAKNAFFKEALERMWPVLKNTTRGAAVLSATLAKTALGKALGPLDLLIDASPSPRGTGELTPEIIEEFKKGQAQERMNKQGGGMMDINRMTVPLGYANGGPAGMTQDEFIKAQMIQEDDPRDLSKLSKFDQFISDRFPVDPRFTAKEEIKDVLRTGREIGSKGLEGIKEIGSKSLGAIKYAVEELIGAGPAEGSESYISPGEAKDMSTEDLEKEIHGFNPYEFGGQGYSWKNLRTIQIVIDELMSRLGDD